MSNEPLLLSIDTSCDDTSAAVTQGVTVLSNIVASQTELHKPFGGVFPTVAKQAHKENIQPTIQMALKRARVELAKIDAIAVTQGPGLAPALEVGIQAAQDLAIKTDKPLIAVNHVEGHILSVLAKRKEKKHSVTQKILKQACPVVERDQDDDTLFPILSIVVSGKHTEFVLVKDIGSYEILGTTIDDAAGEALDKIGRMLDLGYPAGPVMEEFAKLGNSQKYPFPLPMTTSDDYNLSFSGLKTYARNLIETEEADHPLTKQEIYDLCASFQYAVFRHLLHKLSKILETAPISGQVWLGGGVAGNVTLRAMIRHTLRNSAQPQLTLKVPYTKRLCGDNAAMIGLAGYYQYLKKEFVIDVNQLDREPRKRL